jgi:hypothetical protein
MHEKRFACHFAGNGFPLKISIFQLKAAAAWRIYTSQIVQMTTFLRIAERVSLWRVLG